MQQKSTLKDCFFLFFWISLFYFIVLGVHPFLTPDEGRYVEIPREMLSSGEYAVPHLNGIPYFEKPPLFYWMQTLSLAFLGSSTWSMRAWPALLGVLGCLVTYLFTRTIWNRRAGLLASVIQATSFLYFCMAHTITLDSALSFFLTLSLYSLILGIRQLDRKGFAYRRWFYVAYFFAALAIMTKGLIGIIFPILITGLWVLWSGRWSLLLRLQIIPGLLLIALLCLPWHYAMQQKFPEFFDFYFIQQHISRYATPIAHRAMHKFNYFALIIFGMFPWTLFFTGAIQKIWRERKDSEYAVFLAIWGLAIITFFFFSHSILVPYLLPIVAPFSVLLALYINEIWVQKVTMWIRLTFCILCLILGLAFCLAPYFREMGEGVAIWVHFSWIGVLFFALGLIVLWAGAQSTLMFFKALVLGCTLVYTSMVVAMPYANTRSVKPLTDVLKPLMQKEPQAKIVAFDEYFQDMPFYLERTVIVVGWKNELSFGMHLFPGSKAWMIEVQDFWTLWKRDSVYVIGPLWLYEEAKKQGKACVLAWTVENILMVNRECER